MNDTEEPREIIRVEGDACFNFTCPNDPTDHAPIVVDGRTILYVPVCGVHIEYDKGKFGYLSMGEVKWFKRFERLIRWLGKHT